MAKSSFLPLLPALNNIITERQKLLTLHLTVKQMKEIYFILAFLPLLQLLVHLVEIQ